MWKSRQETAMKNVENTFLSLCKGIRWNEARDRRCYSMCREFGEITYIAQDLLHQAASFVTNRFTVKTLTQACKLREERNGIGRREKWPKKVGGKEKSGRKCREYKCKCLRLNSSCPAIKNSANQIISFLWRWWTSEVRYIRRKSGKH